jgi:hypothetical protein
MTTIQTHEQCFVKFVQLKSKIASKNHTKILHKITAVQTKCLQIGISSFFGITPEVVIVVCCTSGFLLLTKLVTEPPLRSWSIEPAAAGR